MQIPIASATVAEKQIDEQQRFVNAIILASCVIILADASAGSNASILGINLEISDAYGVAAAILFLMTLMIAQLFARLSDIVLSSDEQEAPKVLASLFGHSWSFNPFSYFGSRPIAMLHASFGMGVLVFVWWLGLIAMVLLWGRAKLVGDSWDYGLWYAYIIAGILALAAIVHVQFAVRIRLAELARPSADADLQKIMRSWTHISLIKCAIAILFAVFGYWLFYQVTHIGI